MQAKGGEHQCNESEDGDQSRKEPLLGDLARYLFRLSKNIRHRQRVVRAFYAPSDCGYDVTHISRKTYFEGCAPGRIRILFKRNISGGRRVRADIIVFCAGDYADNLVIVLRIFFRHQAQSAADWIDRREELLPESFIDDYYVRRAFRVAGLNISSCQLLYSHSLEKLRTYGVPRGKILLAGCGLLSIDREDPGIPLPGDKTVLRVSNRPDEGQSL